MKFSTIAFFILISSCSAQLVETTITGSAETPDPVLERVLTLERSGAVSDVVIMESFPVQIRLKARQQIIDELEALPRVEPTTFR